MDYIKRGEGAGKMTQWVKVPATKPNDLSSIPGIHTVKGESCDYPLTSSCMHAHTHAHLPKCNTLCVWGLI